MLAIGHRNQVASYRVVPRTIGFDALSSLIINSFCPVPGQSSEKNENGRHYSAKEYSEAFLTTYPLWVSMQGNARAGIITPEYAERLLGRCKSLLITWKGMAGEFQSNLAIETSNLHMGINQFLPRGYNKGRHVQF